MIVKETLYALSDVTIVPADSTDIMHRSDINPYYSIDGKKKLPIFVSPMECVINRHNFDIFEKNNLISILPRTESYQLRYDYAKNGKWAAFSKEEFKEAFCRNIIAPLFAENFHIRALIDMAQGSMNDIKTIIRRAKKLASEKGYTIEIMAGNIANPLAYKLLSEAGADYVRCSVGSGWCCITSSNTGVHYPMASLIDECHKLKESFNLHAAIIADGGISTYRDVMKALGLGADYVMIGSRLGSMFESASEFISFDKPSKAYTYYTLSDVNEMRWNGEISEATKKEIIKMYAPMTKTVWGMATRRAQISIALAQGKKLEDIKTKTSEGVEKRITVDYTLSQWVENLVDFLCSAMSYCNAHNLDEYIGKQIFKVLSEGAKKAIND